MIPQIYRATDKFNDRQLIYPCNSINSKKSMPTTNISFHKWKGNAARNNDWRDHAFQIKSILPLFSDLRTFSIYHLLFKKSTNDRQIFPFSVWTSAGKLARVFSIAGLSSANQLSGRSRLRVAYRSLRLARPSWEKRKPKLRTSLPSHRRRPPRAKIVRSWHV